MANEIEKLNTIDITDIEKVNTLSDDDIEKLNTFEFTGVSSNAWQGPRGVMFGGIKGKDNSAGGHNTLVGYITIASTGNMAVTSGGDEISRIGLNDEAVSNGTLALSTTSYATNAYGGYGWTGQTYVYTIAGGSDGTLFGDWDGDAKFRKVQGGAITNATRAVHAGGQEKEGTTGGTNYTEDLDRMDYWTFAAAGDNTDFGDLDGGARKLPGGFNDSTRGVFVGGRSGSPTSATFFDTMEYITTDSTGNTTDFGNLWDGREACGADNDTRGCASAGQTARSQWWNTSYATQRWDYVTTQSTADASDLGDQTATEPASSSMCDQSRAVFGLNAGGIVGHGGSYESGTSNTYSAYQRLDAVSLQKYMTISSTGDESAFGDWAWPGPNTTMAETVSGT